MTAFYMVEALISISNSNTYFVELISLTILFLGLIYINRSYSEHARQFALLPSLTKNHWASLKISLQVASLGPRGKY